jgi:hypothetical protein
MGTRITLMIEEMKSLNVNPFGLVIHTGVQGARHRRFNVDVSPGRTGSPPRRPKAWRAFEDVQVLNEALDDRAFVSEWRATARRDERLIAVEGTLFPYEPICAGSASMWRAYWADMETLLEARLKAEARTSLERKAKVRDWFTHSLFLWGFSMAQPPAPGEPAWLGVGCMDEINSVPVALARGVWDQSASGLFAGRDRAWKVRLTGHLEIRPATAAAGPVQRVFRTLERKYYLVVRSPDQVEVLEKAVFFSAYVWALFETPGGDFYAIWEHANIADPDLFQEGIARLARKARELREPGDRVVAALAPEVAAEVERDTP